jgi:hypothetical protein
VLRRKSSLGRSAVTGARMKIRMRRNRCMLSVATTARPANTNCAGSERPHLSASAITAI